jgi:diaminopimelate decarboxylase
MRIDDCLSSRDDVLYIEEVASTALRARFGSPLFVFSEDQIRRNVRRFQKAFSSGWTCGPVKVMPAVKASWALAIQRVLADAGCGADVYSAGELDVALRAGCEPRFISVNGVPKTRDHIERTLAVGARLTIDSLRDVEILEALDLPREVSVRLRLRPALSDFVASSDMVAEGLVPTDLAALAYKGGLSFDEVIEAGRRILRLPRVSLVGFHQHHGRHKASTAYWRAQMRSYARDLGRVCSALGGVRPQEISIGGGFAIPRDPHNAATDYAAPALYGTLTAVSAMVRYLGERVRYRTIDALLTVLEARPNSEPAPDIETYARVCTSELQNELDRHGMRTAGLMLQLEPGRAIHGNAGLHLTTVEAVKRMTKPIHWNVVTLDTSEFWLTGGRFEHHLHDFRVANRMSAQATMKADVCGRSCYSDRLLGAVRVPDLAPGDLFAFLDTGAYQEVSASNFNAMPRPASILVTGDSAAVIRRAETLDDVFARDELPAHLRDERARLAS